MPLQRDDMPELQDKPERQDIITGAPTLANADLAVVVELQRAELDRLLRENKTLHDRIDQLIGLQEREQVLRQQMQGLFIDKDQAHTQATLEDTRHTERVRAAGERYDRLKTALVLLLGAIEKQNNKASIDQPDHAAPEEAETIPAEPEAIPDNAPPAPPKA